MQAEYRNHHSISKSGRRWLGEVLKPYRGRIALLILLVSLRALLQLGQVVIIRSLIDAAVAGNQSAFTANTVWLIAVVFASTAINSIRQYYHGITESRMEKDLRQRLFNKLLTKDYTKVREKHSAEWMNRIISDVNTVSKTTVKEIPGLIDTMIQLIGAVVLLVTVIPWVLIVTVVGALIVCLIGYLLKEPIKKRRRAVREADGQQRIHFTEHLSQLMIVKAFNREPVISQNADRLGETVCEKQRDRVKLNTLTGFIKNIGLRAVYFFALLYGALQILRGKISYGSFTMILNLVNKVRTPLAESASYLTTYYDLMVSAERLQEVEDFPDDPAVPVLSDEEIHGFYQHDFRAISLQGAGFVYRDYWEEGQENLNPIVFSGVNLTIPKQSCVAITGITGSGKSTLFKLLMSLYPLQEGRCVVQTNAGEERDLDASFRRLFAFVPQGNQLMSGSIREMVTFGERDDASRTEEIRQALDTACALSFVDQLPQGLDTVIREKGLGLSEGQLQRIAIARALFIGRPILLLDEATSSLDEATEKQLLQKLKKLQDRTILIVTHRPAALAICDQEIHIDKGAVTVRSINYGLE